jgi:hypothetical protein
MTNHDRNQERDTRRKRDPVWWEEVRSRLIRMRAVKLRRHIQYMFENSDRPMSRIEQDIFGGNSQQGTHNGRE